MKRIIFLTVVLLAVISKPVLLAQTFSADILIRNQPQTTILFGAVKGDDFIRIDSIRASESNSRVKFSFPENAHSGVYRIIFGNTGYERIMNKPPHQLDLIFDNENIEIETDFNSTEESLKIKQSKENLSWYSFRGKDRELMERISKLEAEINKTAKISDTIKFNEIVNEYNQLQMERDMFVVQASQDCRGLFVSQVIKNQRLPVLDGFLSEDERIKTFKADFFRVLDFSNSNLIYSQVYTDNIFNYLVRYNSPFLTQKQRETEYQKAVDVIMPNVKQNAEVYRFVKSYLLHGFEVLKMNALITYINKKYPWQL